METLILLFCGGMCIAPILGTATAMFVALSNELDDWSTKRRAKNKSQKAKKKKKAKKNIDDDSGWWMVIRG